MLQGLDVFLSRHDIQSGSRWGLELARELETASFGILCLTAANQTAPWLLYEAGALTRQLEARSCGLLLGELTPANISGPLAQFQHRRLIKEDFFKLVRDLNTAMKAPLGPDHVKLVFDKWWADLESRYQALLKTAIQPDSPGQARSDREVLEELLERVRVLPAT